MSTSNKPSGNSVDAVATAAANSTPAPGPSRRTTRWPPLRPRTPMPGGFEDLVVGADRRAAPSGEQARKVTAPVPDVAAGQAAVEMSELDRFIEEEAEKFAEETDSDPLFQNPAWRRYDHGVNRLWRVGRVVPAMRHKGYVSLKRRPDNRHLLVSIETVTGQTGELIVSRDGWLPVEILETAKVWQISRNHKVVFTHGVATKGWLGALGLSQADRKKLAAAILGTFLGQPDWPQAQLQQRRRY